MKLKNVLLVVNDIEKSVKFYRELFGLQVLMRQEGNIILTEGLVLQDKKIWRECLEQKIFCPNYAMLLYFEEKNISCFWEKLSLYENEIQIISPIEQNEYGQKMIRVSDLDGHIIEVRTPML